MFEWGVIQKIRGGRPVLMPEVNWNREDAEGYRQWLIERDKNTAIAARKEQAANFPSGNHNYYMWHHGSEMRALKDATYHLVTRTVTDWEDVEWA